MTVDHASLSRPRAVPTFLRSFPVRAPGERRGGERRGAACTLLDGRALFLFLPRFRPRTFEAQFEQLRVSLLGLVPT